MSLDYLMKKQKPLATKLNVGGGYTTAGKQKASFVSLNPLGLNPKLDLNKWTKSQVLSNLAKWRIYSNLYSGRLWQYETLKRDVEKYKKVKALLLKKKDSKGNLLTSWDQYVQLAPYVPGY